MRRSEVFGIPSSRPESVEPDPLNCTCRNLADSVPIQTSHEFRQGRTRGNQSPFRNHRPKSAGDLNEQDSANEAIADDRVPWRNTLHTVGGFVQSVVANHQANSPTRNCTQRFRDFLPESPGEHCRTEDQECGNTGERNHEPDQFGFPGSIGGKPQQKQAICCSAPSCSYSLCKRRSANQALVLEILLGSDRVLKDEHRTTYTSWVGSALDGSSLL